VNASDAGVSVSSRLPLGAVIGTGARSTVFALGRDRVVKVPLPDTPDAWIRREAEFSVVVHSLGLRVPLLHDLTVHDDRLVVVYERIYGPSMWASICDRPSTAPAMGELLADLHLQVFDCPAPMSLPRQRDRLACKIRAARSYLGTDADLARELLPSESSVLQLCHGDLHPGNVIMSAEGPVLLDWFDASRGLAVADVARSSLLMGVGGRADSSMPYLVPVDRVAVRALHDSYMGAISERTALFDDDQFSQWLRLAAAARLAEGFAADDLLALWRTRTA
jgi:aminoglycoside phosphotransferase (APT) family kinase protein